MKRLAVLLCLLVLFSASCQAASEPVEDVATVVESEIVVASQTPLPTAMPTVPNENTPTSATTAPDAATEQPADTPAEEDGVPVGPVDDELALTLLYQLTGPDSLAVFDATDYMRESGDQRFMAAFIEMMRASQLGISQTTPEYWAANAEILSGQDFGSRWSEWIAWYGGTELQPPPGFTGWKGALLSRIDPQFGLFLQDDHPSNARVEEIQWGGVRVDGIPALDNASQIPAAEATYLQPEEPVFGIAINGEAHAYPLRIIDWHEMANDVVGGVPVSLAYCTLCGAAIAYHGVASDGTTYDFGSSGFLYRSNKLMYDRQTRTLWNQLTGEPVLGPLVATDIKLELLPVVLTSWGSWQEQHPETLVLDIDTGYDRDYRLGAAYGSYFAANGLMFPVWQRSDLLDNKDQIYALTIDGTPKAYPIELLTAEQVVNDTLAGTELVLIAQRGVVDVAGNDRRQGAVEYSAGAEVRVYERAGHTFVAGGELDQVVDETGRIWTISEEALSNDNGETLVRINGHLAYWFGWFAFFPNTLLYES